MTQLVRYRVDRGIARLTLDSPANRNALSSQLVDELHQHLQAAGSTAGMRAVVLDHTGTTFCAGADLKEASSGGGPATNAQRVLDCSIRPRPSKACSPSASAAPRPGPPRTTD
jgi:enoyl-CoA hydratase